MVIPSLWFLRETLCNNLLRNYTESHREATEVHRGLLIEPQIKVLFSE